MRLAIPSKSISILKSLSFCGAVILFVSGSFKEGRRRFLSQGHKTGKRRLRERELELHRIVDRVKRAVRQEIEIAPLRIEAWRAVCEQRLGHGADFARFDIGDGDRGLRRAPAFLKGEPRPSGEKAKLPIAR